ncbi:hypothetical protein HOP50_01g01110 [Chloropicon primus]|nr:hypothetical protein HOP50_01g01110 [Chloropicon primus]
MAKQANGVDDTTLNVPANFRELTVFTSTRPDSPPLTGPDYTTVDGQFYKRELDGTLRPVSTKDFVGKTPLERNMELEREEQEAEAALVDAQLMETRAWLRQVEEENELKLRERLQEQRKEQQEHFRKLDIRDDYLPPHLAFGSLPTGQSMLRKRKGEEEEEEDEEDPSTASESNAWADTVHNNQIAGTPVTAMHHEAAKAGSLSPKRAGSSSSKRKGGTTSPGGIALRLFLFILHDIGVVILCLWIFHKTQGKDANKIPWKWFDFTEDENSAV